MAKKASNKFDVESYAYPVCREQHVWRPYDGTIDEKQRLAFRVQKCMNCPTKRHSVISMRPASYGQLFKHPTYVYPDDYQVEGGLDRGQRGLIRIHNFLTETEKGHGKK